LSPREEEILRLLAEGMTDREIGEALTISTRTVESHVSNILRKLDARNRAAAARLYLERR
jgi:DNA-binding NarL/FixJ family response regulator